MILYPAWDFPSPNLHLDNLPTVRSPVFTCDPLDQPNNEDSPEPPNAVQEEILLGALNSMDQDYRMWALRLGTMLAMPPENDPELDAATSSDDECNFEALSVLSSDA